MPEERREQEHNVLKDGIQGGRTNSLRGDGSALRKNADIVVKYIWVIRYVCLSIGRSMRVYISPYDGRIYNSVVEYPVIRLVRGTNLLSFWQEWSSELSVGTDVYRQYMVQHETEMPVRWDTMEPTLEILIREGEVYAVVATFSWVRTVIEDDVSIECYDCGEDALVVSSAWGHFLLSGEDEANVTLGHGLALQFIRILLEMGHTATVHALNV